MRISINILGVCVCRDIFGLHDDNGGYDIKRYSSAFAPLFSTRDPTYIDEIEYDKCVANISDISRYIKRCVKNDLLRKSINFIVEEISDYLLIDVALLRTNYIELENGELYYGTYLKIFETLHKHGLLPPIKQIKPFDRFTDEELRSRLKLYIDRILEIYPVDRIILVEVKNVYKKVDYSKQLITQFINNDIPLRQDPFLKKCFEIVKDLLKGCHVIYMPDNVLGDEHHHLKVGFMHYTQEYYDYALKAIDLICSEKYSMDEEVKMLESLRCECSEQYMNLYKTIRKNICNQVAFSTKSKAKFLPKSPLSLKGNEVKIKTAYSLISNGYERELLLNNERFPLNAGIAAVGYVLEKGSSVKTINIGDRVFVENGGHSDIIVKGAINVVAIPNSVPFECAVFAKAAGTAIEAIRRSSLELGESVVVAGAGLVGHFAVKFAKMAGAYPVICIERDESRKESISHFGADYVFSPDDPNLSDNIFLVTNEKNFKKGASVVIEASGTENAFLGALEYACPQGRIILCGNNVTMNEPVNLYEKVYKKGLHILGIPDRIRPPYNSSPGNWTAKRDYLFFFNLMADGIIDIHGLLNKYVSPQECEQIYNELLKYDTYPFGILFDWSKSNKEL